jgi:hypothetical protein
MKWKKIEDGLPITQEVREILVANPDCMKIKEIQHGGFIGKGNLLGECFTHWMELPSLPVFEPKSSTRKMTIDGKVLPFVCIDPKKWGQIQ